MRYARHPSAGLLTLAALAVLSSIMHGEVRADAPTVSYIFPAGGPRGATVDFHVGGHYLHERCEFMMPGDGIQPPSELVRGTSNLWFDGPRIPLPASQRKEDYPWPQWGKLTLNEDASLGIRYWRVRTAQGITSWRQFVVGDLPEVIEEEIDGAPVPVEVSAPVTINGRIYPREDVDVWTIQCKRGEKYVCEVLASRIGSPLDSRLAVHDATGKLVAENVDALGSDSRLQFVAAHDGPHHVRIDDANFNGLQDYVYRLTITSQQHLMSVYPLGAQAGTTTTFNMLGANIPQDLTQRAIDLPPTPLSHEVSMPGSNALPWRLELSSDKELVESLDGQQRGSFVVPSVLNGRLTESSQEDVWPFKATQGQSLTFVARAAQLGSPLDSVLEIRTPSGETLAENDDGHPSGDPKLVWTPKQDGEYHLVVRDAFGGRRVHDGELYSYRIHCSNSTPPAAPYDFALSVSGDTLNAPLGGAASLEVKLLRHAGFKELISVHVYGLPEEVTYDTLELKKNTKKATLKFNVSEKCPLDICRLRVVGKVQPMASEKAAPAKKSPKDEASDETNKSGAPSPPSVVRVANIESVAGTHDNHVTLAPSLATPFKLVGQFETKYGACGSEFRRSFHIERNGFEGPLRVRMAERQVRHLQGVTGDEVVVPAGAETFDFTIRLAPWMEVGRTSRTCLMVVGQIQGPNGGPHTVSYTSHAQNDQIIVLVDPAPLAVAPMAQSIIAEPGQTIRLPVRVARGPGVEGAVRLELVPPLHYQDVHCEPVTVAADQGQGELTIRFGKSLGTLNAPLTIRATTLGSRSLIAEAKVEL